MSGPDHAGGMRDGIESVARKSAPEPKGKALVMIILAVSVLGALAWEFSGHGPASQAAMRAVGRAQQEDALEEGPDGTSAPPVARQDPNDPAASKPASTSAQGPTQGPTQNPRKREPAPGTIDVQIGATLASLPPALAVAAWLDSSAVASGDDAAAGKRDAMRMEILEALVPLARKGGSGAHEAFEAAAWLIDGIGEDGAEVILHLTNATTAALEDDRAALGAILFLSRVPDGVDKRTGLSLDSVIVNGARPLSIRLAAAHIRPSEGRSKRVRELVEDAGTHPALRDALK